MWKIFSTIWISRKALEGYAMQFPICIGTGSAGTVNKKAQQWPICSGKGWFKKRVRPQMLRSNPTLNTHFEEVSHSDIKVRINQNNKQISYSQLFVKIGVLLCEKNKGALKY